MSGSEPSAGTATFTVTPEIVGEYRAATTGAETGTSTTVPPTLASVFTYAAVAAMPTKDGVVLAGQEFDFHGAIEMGDTLVTDYAVADRYERRGRDYMVLRTETRNQRQELIVVGRIIRLLPVPAAEGDR